MDKVNSFDVLKERLIELVLESAGESRLSLDDFVGGLRKAVKDRAGEVKASGDDYTPDEYDYWQDQARCTRYWHLQHELIQQAHGELGAAAAQSLSSDDQIIMEHVRSAHKVLGIVMRSMSQSANSSASGRG